MPGHAPPRSDDLIAYHRREIAEGYLLRGETQRSIAKRLGLSQAQVSGDIKYLVREWEQEAAKMVTRVKAEELQRINWVEWEARNAWEQSKMPLTTTRRDKGSTDIPTTDKEGKPALIGQQVRSRVQETTRNQTGDVRYLKQIQWCIEMRLKLWNALPQQNGNITVNNTGTIELAGPGIGFGPEPGQVPGIQTLGQRLAESLRSMRPEGRTLALDRFHDIITQADALNQQLLSLPVGLPNVVMSEEGSEEDEEGTLKPPANVRVIDGEVRYVDEEGVEEGIDGSLEDAGGRNGEGDGEWEGGEAP